MNPDQCSLRKPRDIVENSGISAGCCACRAWFRRGLFIVELAGAGMTLAPSCIAFPLETVGIDTRGRGHGKLEWNVARAVQPGAAQREVEHQYELSLAHGVLDNIDIKLAAPYRLLQAGDAMERAGIGDLEVGVKWRAWQAGGWALGTTVDLTLPSGDAARQLGTGKPTQAITAIAQYAQEDWAAHLNAGYRHHRNARAQRTHLGRFSVGVARHWNSQWKGLADLGVETPKDRQRRQAVLHVGVGLAYAFARHWQIELGLKRDVQGGARETAGLLGINVKY